MKFKKNENKSFLHQGVFKNNFMVIHEHFYTHEGFYILLLILINLVL